VVGAGGRRSRQAVSQPPGWSWWPGRWRCRPMLWMPRPAAYSWTAQTRLRRTLR